MQARRLDKTAVDYVAIALAPGLIMGLVGSLVFFLLEVTYRGEHAGRLSWILFWFVFAAVLIARIAITEGTAHAGIYGAVLALVTAVAIFRFVDQAIIGCLLLAVIWWCAHKLTWDCTLIDEQEEESGQGVLESAGMDYEAPYAEDTQRRDRALGTARGAWWRELAIGIIEPDRRPHAPGVWVVYFSLAALPLFGVGQLLIPASDAARRNHAFVLLCVYLACGLGLLLVTSFLGLRRYLRQRRLEMPISMTGAWMGAGVALIAVLLLVAALLPSPSGAAQWKLPEVFSLTSPERSASPVALLREDGAEGEGAESEATGQRDDESTDEHGDNSNSRQPGDADGGSSEIQADGQTGSNDPGDSAGGGEQKSSGANDDNASGQPSNTDRVDELPPEDQPPKGQAGGTGKPPRNAPSKGGSGQPASQSQSKPPVSSQPFSLPQLSGSWGQWLKWLFYLVLALMAVYFCLRHRDQVRDWLTQLINELRGIFSGLFGRRGTNPKETPVAETPPPRPFALFSDPFQDGTAAGRSPDELVRYSFAALEAWAAEYGGGRRPEWTPAELAAHLAREHSHLSATAPPLATLYARLAYAGQSLSPECLGTVRRFWRALSENDVEAASTATK